MASEKRTRVLVVDDDKELLGLVNVLLSRVGIEVITAETATEAARILRTPPLPDMLILDLMLPDISGMELLRQMRAKEMFKDLPVLILSALADPNQIREGLESGADRYLTKPYVAHNLTGTVQELIRTGRRRQE